MVLSNVLFNRILYTDIPSLVTASVPAILVMCSSYFLNVGGQVFFWLYPAQEAPRPPSSWR